MGKQLLLLVLNQIITPANAGLQGLFFFQMHSHLLREGGGGVFGFDVWGFFLLANGEEKQKAEARHK